MVKTFVKGGEMLSVSAAAKILGVSIDTVRRWDKSGKLHSERLNGKDRYFSSEELEKIKFAKSLSISEAAMQLKISPTTLRRLEKKGFINPRRTQSGERVYDGDVIRKFLESDYFIGEKGVKERVPESLEKNEINEKELIKNIAFESETQHLEGRGLARNVENPSEIPTEPPEERYLVQDLKPLQRIPEIAMITMVFLALVMVGLKNINASPNKVLGLTATPAVTLAPSPMVEEEKKTKTMLVIKIDDAPASAQVNIRQKPTANSEKIGTARDGDIFEFVSVDSGWYEVKLATGSGFINGAFIKTEGTNK